MKWELVCRERSYARIDSWKVAIYSDGDNIIIIIIVEKRKISYFGLARNLIRHLISPNQDDLSYSARTFISG